MSGSDPVLCVILYMDVDVDDEDSLSERLTENMEPDLFLTAPAMRLCEDLRDPASEDLEFHGL